MRDYIISTDSTADLPESYREENKIYAIPFSYLLNDKVYGHGEELTPQEFYAAMRKGAMPTTSQINPEEARKIFEGYLKQGLDILHIAFSSGLSGSYNSCRIAAQELKEEYPDAKIIVIDSLCASLGEGLFVHKAVEMKKQGRSIEENAKWLSDHIPNMVHVFTVDDLYHLYRGGRVSKTAAVLGTMVDIKPILHVDMEGHLVPVRKVRGRKKSLNALVDYMEKKMGSFRSENDIFFISHGDAKEDAEYVANLVKERFGIQDCLIDMVGPTIGAHSGPGTIALFFLGESR